MGDSFTFLLGGIIVTAVVLAIIRKRARDKCLKDFEDNMVTLDLADAGAYTGKLRVEASGLEVIFPDIQETEDVPGAMSFILYKTEYPRIQALVRFHDDLSDENRENRKEDLERTYHPTLSRRMKRGFLNLCKTMRDSAVEIVDLVLAQAKKAKKSGAAIAGQDKHVSSMKKELLDATGNAYDPLLEHRIGRRVIVEMKKGEETMRISGILKEYTADFVELMDIRHGGKGMGSQRNADMIIPRVLGIVRHLGEEL